MSDARTMRKQAARYRKMLEMTDDKLARDALADTANDLDTKATAAEQKTAAVQGEQKQSAERG